MEGWIVKHKARPLYLYSDEDDVEVGAFPTVFQRRRDAEWASGQMDVECDWQVVKVEITEKT